MITAKLQGRRLILTAETGDDEQAVSPFAVAPLSAREGREMSVRYVFATEGLPDIGGSVQEDMLNAFGAENYRRADEELRAEEMELMLQAAYFWQTVGGMDSVRGLLEVGEDGTQGGDESKKKAIAAFQLRTAPLLSQIRHRLASALRTNAASTPDTDIPSGSETSGSEPGEKPSEQSPPRKNPPKRSPKRSPSRSPQTSD